MGFGGGDLKGLTSGGLLGDHGILKHPSLSNIIGGGTGLLGGDKKPASKVAIAPIPPIATQSNQTPGQSLTTFAPPQKAAIGTSATGEDTGLSGPNILK